MKAMVIPVGEDPRVIEIEGDLKSMQKVVGGLIEPCSFVFDNDPAIYCNEEGLFCCQPNRAVYATRENAEAGYISQFTGQPLKEGELFEILFGDLLAVGFNPETGENRDLAPEEIVRVMERFGGAKSCGSGLAEVLRVKAGLVR